MVDTADKFSNDSGKQWYEDMTLVTFMGAMNWFDKFTDEEIENYNKAVARPGSHIGFDDLDSRTDIAVFDSEGTVL